MIFVFLISVELINQQCDIINPARINERSSWDTA